jgi:hypothetical protein
MTTVTDIKKHILVEAGRIVTGARRNAYGTPEDNFARIARFWQAYFENTGRGSVNITAQDVSPMMRLMKEARLCESPDHFDSFVDLVGYALTGAEVNRLKVPTSSVGPFDPAAAHAEALANRIRQQQREGER